MADPFSGGQAYKDKQGRTRLFRPDLNMARVRNIHDFATYSCT